MTAILKRQQYNDLIPAGVAHFDHEGLIGAIPKVQIAHKTGTISGVRHDSGIVYLPNCSYALTILSKGLKDAAVGAKQIVAISKAIYEYWA
jgi:beta-lactamase class A